MFRCVRYIPAFMAMIGIGIGIGMRVGIRIGFGIVVGTRIGIGKLLAFWVERWWRYDSKRCSP